MAASGFGSGSFQSSLYKGSEDYAYSCGQCWQDNQHVKAYGYCRDCDRYLCMPCYKEHSLNRASRHHKLLDTSYFPTGNVPKLSNDTGKEKCPDHESKIIKFYCQDHRKVGCCDCILLSHRTCEIKSIEKICEGFDDTAEYHYTMKKLDVFLQDIANTEKAAEIKTIKLDKVQQNMFEKLETFQDDIINRVEAIKGKEVEKIKKATEVYERLAKDIKKIRSSIKGFAKAKMDGQVFISVKKADLFLKSVDSSVIENMILNINTDIASRFDESILHMLRQREEMSGVLSQNFAHESCEETNCITDQSQRENFDLTSSLDVSKGSDIVVEDENPCNFSDEVVTRGTIWDEGCGGHFEAIRSNIPFVATIQIGVTNSSCALMSKFDQYRLLLKSWPSEYYGLVEEIPNSLLLNPDKSFHAFGFEAQEKYAELKKEGIHNRYFYFGCFTMQLQDKTEHMEINAVNGRSIKMTEVFGAVIKYLKENLMKSSGLSDQDLDAFLVLTLPAIWNAKVENCMREASEMAGIKRENLDIVNEHVAVLCWRKHLKDTSEVKIKREGNTMFSKGTKYMVVYAGAESTTISLYEVVKLNEIREMDIIHECEWGDRHVDAAFENFLEDITGKDNFKQFKTDPDNSHKLYESLRVLKTSTRLNQSEKVTMTIPSKLRTSIRNYSGRSTDGDFKRLKYEIVQSRSAIRLATELVRSWYDEPCRNISDFVKSVFKRKTSTGVQTVLLVGVLSEKQIFQEAMEKALPDKCLIIPKDASFTVIRGAALYGFDPISVTKYV